VLAEERGRRCWGGTKGLAGVTKGMVVSRPRMRMGPTSTRVGTPVVVHEGVGTFVARARTWAVVD